MAPQVTGQHFAGFDLGDARSLRQLANGIEYYSTVTRDLASRELRRLSQFQRGTAAFVVQKMERSPLFKELVMILLSAPRGVIDTSQLMEAGRILRDYAVAGSDTPSGAAYAEVAAAWEGRVQIGGPTIVRPEQKGKVEAVVQESEGGLERRKRETGSGENAQGDIVAGDASLSPPPNYSLIIANSTLQVDSEEAKKKKARALVAKGDRKRKEETAKRKVRQERERKAQQLLEAQRTKRAKRLAEHKKRESLAGNATPPPAPAASMLLPPPRRPFANAQDLDEQLARALQHEEEVRAATEDGSANEDVSLQILP